MKKLYLLTSIIFSSAMILYANISIATEIPREIFSVGEVIIGVTTIGELQSRYGQSVSYRVGKEDESDIEVCYSSQSSKDESFIVFESGVMGNFKEITGFRLSAMHPRNHCLSTNLNIKQMTTGNGVHLGLSSKQFVEKFPFKFRHRKSELSYESVSQRPATEAELKKIRATWPDAKQDFFDVTITIKANFKEDRLVDFYVHKIESY